ncbi:MAG: hypothetical protein HZA90_23115 [Verrucomicrobia bacterium]|nr:hypothetical protein [Verrucomicrobiota bacterium]
MNIFDGIEKLITEHGSAAILSQQLALAKDQFAQLERKVSDLQTQTGRLEAQLAREQVDHKKARVELQRLEEEHAEEVVIHRLVEFRRGKRTRGKWVAFCPKCHMPADGDTSPDGEGFVYCTADCGWRARAFLSFLIGELGG